jgi:predicted unusual protein kinase regulating ubiquinone biosynthesis (AarF/ABC1/UbiB family)
MNEYKQILFLFEAFSIICAETFIYFIYNDYSSFIERLTQKLSSINILYVKVFQAFALNNSLIDDKTNNQLLKFTDNAPWTLGDIRFEDLIEIEDKYNLQFENSYYTPMNTGMISIVFKAYDKTNNKTVIVKTKRQNIEEKLDDAIDNLLFFMYILSFIPLVNKYHLAEVINKNIGIIRQQTNFSEEVDNMIRIKNNCKNLKYVKIPEVYKEVTDLYPNVIMMEYIHGITIDKILEEDYECFAKQVMKFGIVTSVVHGVTHGDLHAGNILFIKDDTEEKYTHKIGVLDFGIIYDIENNYKTLLFECITEMFTSPSLVTAEKFINSGIIEPADGLKNLSINHYNNIVNFTAEIIEETVQNSKKANQLQVYKFLNKFKSYLSNNEISELGLRLSANFVKTQLVVAMSHGVTLTLCKDDYFTLADTVLNELFHINMIL